MKIYQQPTTLKEDIKQLKQQVNDLSKVIGDKELFFNHLTLIDKAIKRLKVKTQVT